MRLSSPQRAGAMALLIGLAAGCDGVEDRSGVVGVPSREEAAGGLSAINIVRDRVLIYVALDQAVEGYNPILASASLADVRCASGADFRTAQTPSGTPIEFRVDTGQDYDSADPPPFIVTEVLVGC